MRAPRPARGGKVPARASPRGARGGAEAARASRRDAGCESGRGGSHVEGRAARSGPTPRAHRHTWPRPSLPDSWQGRIRQRASTPVGADAVFCARRGEPRTLPQSGARRPARSRSALRASGPRAGAMRRASSLVGLPERPRRNDGGRGRAAEPPPRRKPLVARRARAGPQGPPAETYVYRAEAARGAFRARARGARVLRARRLSRVLVPRGRDHPRELGVVPAAHVLAQRRVVRDDQARSRSARRSRSTPATRSRPPAKPR